MTAKETNLICLLYIFCCLCLEAIRGDDLHNGFDCVEVDHAVSGHIARQYLLPTYICQELSHSDSLLTLPADTVSLEITNSSLTDFDGSHLPVSVEYVKLSNSLLSLIKIWPSSLKNLQHITIENCWSKTLEDKNFLHKLNPRKVLSVIPEIWFELPALKSLNFINCNVKRFSNSFMALLKRINLLQLTGGGYECSKEKDLWLWKAVDDRRIIISNRTKCFVDIDEDIWGSTYSFINSPLITILGYKNETQFTCPTACDCSVTGINPVHIRPIIHVDCPNAKLSELPVIIPPLATRCNFSYNNISDIEVFFTSPNYRNVQEMILSHNKINHISGELLYKFSTQREKLDFGIDLSYNRLTRFPVAAINHVYEEMKRMGKEASPTLFLRENPWNCDDCSFISDFRVLLLRYPLTILDSGYVRCSEDDSYFPNESVKSVDVNSRCVYISPHPLDVLNIFLGLILLIVIVDFAYNYYQYKYHSRLPWIITACQFNKFKLCKM